MRILKTFVVLSLILFANEIFGQELPSAYPAMFNEMITNFETIRGSNTIKKAKNTLTVISEEKIVLRTTHKKQVKNLTFIYKPDEENKMHWVAANQLTTDMVNKHEEFLTETLQTMLELSREKAQE